MDYAAFLVTYYFGTTSTQIWQSTDGVTYTNVGTAGLSSGDQFFTVGGLTRNQKYYFKFKAVGPGGISGFSNVHYMWDVDTIGISYATALATDFGLAGYEIEEYNRVDLLWQTIQGYGLDTGLYQLYLFSPSAGATISMYDIISASYMTQNGGTISGSGVDFNYDGYLDTNAVPGGGASIGTGKSWMINVATHNTFNNIVPGAATYAAIAGAYDGTNRIEIGVYNTGATGILYGQEGLVTNVASVSIGSDASGLGTFNTFGAAFDIRLISPPEDSILPPQKN